MNPESSRKGTKRSVACCGACPPHPPRTTRAWRGLGQVDDAAVFYGRLTGGSLATFEATRFAWGRKNAIRLEINGEAGSLAFDFEDMNVLHFFDASEPARTAGFRRIVVTEADHPFVGAWWPAGHGHGDEHGFTHQVVDLVEAVAAGAALRPTFDDGLQVQRVLDAVERSSLADNVWVPVPVPGPRRVQPAAARECGELLWHDR